MHSKNVQDQMVKSQDHSVTAVKRYKSGKDMLTEFKLGENYPSETCSTSLSQILK